tara:strand:- start:8248 stop:8703 length:456 start_codon:yes stop_codon:yes gene_type:complete
MEDSRGQGGEVGGEEKVRRVYGALPASKKVETGDEEQEPGKSPPPKHNKNKSKKERTAVYLKGRLERIAYRALNEDWMERDDLRIRMRMYGLGYLGRVQLHYTLIRLERKGLIERMAKKTDRSINEWLWRKTKASSKKKSPDSRTRKKEGS